MPNFAQVLSEKILISKRLQVSHAPQEREGNIIVVGYIKKDEE